jgi:hypothetical protein
MDSAMAKETVYDLGKLAIRLPQSHSDFKGKIERWRDAHSSSADLKIAADFLELALRLHLNGDGEMELAKMGLLHAAVVAYGRAFEVSPDHRREFSVAGNMNAPQKAMHAKLIELRHQSIGHHGPAGTIEPWSQDFALLVQNGVHWQPLIASKKRVFEPEFVRSVHRHLEEIQPLVLANVERKRELFQSMFDEKAMLSEIAELLEECTLDQAEIDLIAGPLLSGKREGRKIVIANDIRASKRQ